MPYLIGFVIALFIALTGVGAGTITVPVLVLFLNVPAAIGSGAHWFSHPLSQPLLLQLTAGGLAGAIGETLPSNRIPRHPLRLALWFRLLLLSGQFLFNSYQAWLSPHKETVSQYQPTRR